MFNTKYTVLAMALAVVCQAASSMAAAQDYDRSRSSSSGGSIRQRRSADNSSIVSDENQQFQKIPLDVLRRIAEMEEEEFLNSLLEPGDNASEQELALANRGLTGGERTTNLTIAKSAGCKVAPTVVSLLDNLPTDPRFHFFPQCTRVNRCTGCCPSSLLACEPTASTELLLHVRNTSYNGESGVMQAVGVVAVIIDEHQACTCGCRIKEADCNRLQKYNADDCQCNCTNISEQERCYESTNKFWDPQTCVCSCRDANRECTTGTVFDTKTCRCVQEKKQYSAFDRKLLIVKPTLL